MQMKICKTIAKQAVRAIGRLDVLYIHITLVTESETEIVYDFSFIFVFTETFDGLEIFNNNLKKCFEIYGITFIAGLFVNAMDF